MSYWDELDLLEPPPLFTEEERKRIDRTYRDLRAKYDPVADELIRARTIPMQKQWDREYAEKLRWAELAAGGKRWRK